MSGEFRPDNRVALENDHPRIEIVEKVTGKARYTTDYNLPRMLHAAYIRCPFGNAKLRKSDLDAARKVPGVLEVELTKQEGRYHGDRIGHVCAESRGSLIAAMRAMKLDWVQQPPRTRLEELRTPMDRLNEPRGLAQADEALRTSDVVVEAEFQTQVQTHCCLEPHGAVVDFRGDSAIACGSTQGTFSFRDELARQLGLRPDQVEFHCEHVGGGFGSKFGAGAEGALAARMSKKYRRPCRVVCDRKEEQTDTGCRPGSIQYMKIGASKDGRLKGGRIFTWGSVGPSGGGQDSAGGGGGGGVRNPSRYRFGTTAKTHEDVTLNGGPPRAMRAPGHPQAMFAVELFMDAMASKLGMDPVEFRILNETNETRKKMLVAGAELIGWNRRKPDGQWPGIVKHGFGIGAGDWGNSGGRASIAINIYRSGIVEVLSGAQDIGTGYRTMIGDCVRSILGIPRDLLVVKVGNSSYPYGPASGGSVTSRMTAPKAFLAAERAGKAIVTLVAKEWNVDPASLKLENGQIVGNGKQIDWVKACKLLSVDRAGFSADEDGNYFRNQTGSEAVQFAEVAVDTETGIVRVQKIVALQEVGLPVNRHTVENQICGAVVQGLSFCLFEERILNRQTGSMVNANLEMYKIAGTLDVPEIVPVIWRSRQDASVNSLGEPPAVPVPGAIACAVANAIGTQVRSMPITPAKVLAAIAGKERG